MKKLLGILATITITGSGMAGLVGNAPNPEKTKQILENNSEIVLMRVKRQVNQIDFENWKTNFNVWKTDVENSRARLSRSEISSNNTDINIWQTKRINELNAQVEILNEIIKSLNTEIKVESSFMTNLKMGADACAKVTSITAPVTNLISTVGSRLSDSIILGIAADLQWILNSICNIVAA
ncbi:hypothetical protein [Spiroplasma endosymbiont of Nephrotoma flavescens]|uniref:hypothetical protein n=1 Tax=Spiroplasma endosymbiont of Nephrotoma flavescens TaxID=3066302 RepID=UPI00313EDEBD